MGFPKQEYWSSLPFPPPGDLSNPGIKPASPAFKANSLLTELWGKQAPGSIDLVVKFYIFPSQKEDKVCFSHPSKKAPRELLTEFYIRRQDSISVSRWTLSMALKDICEGRREKWRYHAKQRVEMAERHPTFQLFGMIRVWEFPMNQIKR